jgi:hypothetical protein
MIPKPSRSSCSEMTRGGFVKTVCPRIMVKSPLSSNAFLNSIIAGSRGLSYLRNDNACAVLQVKRQRRSTRGFASQEGAECPPPHPTPTPARVREKAEKKQHHNTRNNTNSSSKRSRSRNNHVLHATTTTMTTTTTEHHVVKQDNSTHAPMNVPVRFR